MDIENKFFRIFRKEEIKGIIPLSFKFNRRKKIVTYVPLKSTDKLTYELASAGAGKIGKYEMCSFRMKGLGTFLPLKGTKPYSGKTGKLAYEEEIRLEMECDENNIDVVIDALLEHHPYEEVAYEIYDFTKRTNIHSAYFISFKKSLLLNDIIKRINNKIKADIFSKNEKTQSLIINDGVINNKILNKAEIFCCKYIIAIENEKIKIRKI